MEVLIKDVDGVLVFDTIAVITESQYNKINAGINKRRIASWCDDNGNVSVSTDKRAQNTLVFKEVVDVITSTSISDAEKLCLEFLKFVDSLPEVDASTDQPENQETMAFIHDILADIHNAEIVGAIVVRGIGPFLSTWGRMSVDTLAEMCELYLDKHEHKNN